MRIVSAAQPRGSTAAGGARRQGLRSQVLPAERSGPQPGVACLPGARPRAGAGRLRRAPARGTRIARECSCSTQLHSREKSHIVTNFVTCHEFFRACVTNFFVTCVTRRRGFPRGASAPPPRGAFLPGGGQLLGSQSLSSRVAAGGARRTRALRTQTRIDTKRDSQRTRTISRWAPCILCYCRLTIFSWCAVRRFHELNYWGGQRRSHIRPGFRAVVL